MRKAAVAEGMAPKARRPFALFVLENSAVPKGSAKADFLKEMKRLGRKWGALPQADKDKYKLRCKQEFTEQRDALKIHGFQIRRPLDLERAQPSQPSQPSELCTMDSDCAVKEGDVAWKFGNVTVPGRQAPLGEGSYGNVVRGMTPNGRPCAVKIFKCSRTLQSLKQEVLVLNLIKDKIAEQDRHLFPALLATDSKRNPFPFMVLEYGGTSLLQVIQVDGPLSSHSVSVLSLQLQAALQALHAISVLHLDVKPGNILWIKETLQMKLTDFGMAELFGVAACELRFSEYVSAPYRPPELWNACTVELSKHLRPSVDIWACGCVLFESFVGYPLMKPIPPAQSCRDTMQLWCQSWGQLQAAKGPKLGGRAQRVQARLLRAGLLRRALFRHMNPDPASRKWSGPIS